MKILAIKNIAPIKIRDSNKIKNWFFSGFFNSLIKPNTALTPKTIYRQIIMVSDIFNTPNI